MCIVFNVMFIIEKKNFGFCQKIVLFKTKNTMLNVKYIKKYIVSFNSVITTVLKKYG